MNDPGAYIKLEDGTIIPDLNDEAMIERELLKEIVETGRPAPSLPQTLTEGENNGIRTA